MFRALVATVVLGASPAVVDADLGTSTKKTLIVYQAQDNKCETEQLVDATYPGTFTSDCEMSGTYQRHVVSGQTVTYEYYENTNSDCSGTPTQTRVYTCGTVCGETTGTAPIMPYTMTCVDEPIVAKSMGFGGDSACVTQVGATNEMNGAMLDTCLSTRKYSIANGKFTMTAYATDDCTGDAIKTVSATCNADDCTNFSVGDDDPPTYYKVMCDSEVSGAGAKESHIGVSLAVLLATLALQK